MTIWCSKCGGQGRLYQSRYGGNDPDVWDAGECPVCEGSGNAPCSKHGCTELATHLNVADEPLCAKHLAEWNADAGIEENTYIPLLRPASYATLPPGVSWE